MGSKKTSKQINVIMPLPEYEILKNLAEKNERSISQMALILIREGTKVIEKNS